MQKTVVRKNSTILHQLEPYKSMKAQTPQDATPLAMKTEADEPERHPYLVALGQRMGALRARRGMTRKAVALAAGVSERHLANMEYGVGNASVLVLLQVSGALQCAVSELIGDITTSSPEWLMIRELLSSQDDATLQRVRVALGGILGTTPTGDGSVSQRIALIGLRGAGKSTLGAMLAKDLGYPFVELSREIEKLAGASVTEIQALYGANAYRRYERRALEELVKTYGEVVIATPGGLVSEAATFSQLLSQCTTVWLKARPEDHLNRVAEQGDMRPMAASKEAMQDLKDILAGRAAFYSKAQLSVDTSAQDLKATFAALRQTVRQKLLLPQ
jgi:XRE family transcriptional regulator, aerobic/anaerobic benzoate catabolism transcriptional regulator